MTSPATQMLTEDHRKVQELYRRYAQAQNQTDKDGLAEAICHELELHARLEESLFYPALAEAFPDGLLVKNLGGEHGEMKRLISDHRLHRDAGADAQAGNDGRLSSLMTLVERHVTEEEGRAFPTMAANPERDERLGAELGKLKLKLKVSPPVAQAIDLQVPARVAYNQWTQFEAFPRFLDNIKEVRQLDDTHVRWNATVAGKDVCWTAEIFEQVPDQRIAWTTVDGAANSGSVTFRPLGAGTCRMLAEICYEPQGLVEDLGAMLGVVSQRVAKELSAFKAFIESQAEESGAWRGEVQGTPVDPTLTAYGARDVRAESDTAL